MVLVHLTFMTQVIPFSNRVVNPQSFYALNIIRVLVQILVSAYKHFKFCQYFLVPVDNYNVHFRM